MDLRECESRSGFHPCFEPVRGAAYHSVAAAVSSPTGRFTHGAAWLSFWGECVGSTHPTTNTEESIGETRTLLATVPPTTLSEYTLAHLKLIT